MIGEKSELGFCHKHETDIGAIWSGVPWSNVLHVSQIWQSWATKIYKFVKTGTRKNLQYFFTSVGVVSCDWSKITSTWTRYLHLFYKHQLHHVISIDVKKKNNEIFCLAYCHIVTSFCWKVLAGPYTSLNIFLSIPSLPDSSPLKMWNVWLQSVL